MEPSSRMTVNSTSGTALSSKEYQERIPRRIAQLIAGQEEKVEAALGANDLNALEKIADAANLLSIQGRRISPEEVDIARAPTRMEILGEKLAPGERDPRLQVQDDILAGRILEQLFFAGAATRFRKAAQGLLYFFEIWQMVDRVLQAGEGVPDFASGMAPEEFQTVRGAAEKAAAQVPPSRRMRIPLGPRILLSYRVALDRFARDVGESPERVRKRARFSVHIPDSPGGKQMISDLAFRNFYGFHPKNVLLIQQPLFGGWEVRGKSVVPLPGSEEFPYGHGYSTLQLVQPRAAACWQDGNLVELEKDTLNYLAREGSFMVRTHRVNDLTQITPAVLDLNRLAVARRLINRGHVAIIELVGNPHGQKGGNWLELRGKEHRFLLEGMNAKEGGWPEFMERHRGAPYNAFRNIYDGVGLRRVLLDHSLPEHFRIRKLAPPPEAGASASRIGLYLESVTGDLTQIPEARAAAFRFDEHEVIRDLKELKDLPEGIQAVVTADEDEEFRAAAKEIGFN